MAGGRTQLVHVAGIAAALVLAGGGAVQAEDEFEQEGLHAGVGLLLGAQNFDLDIGGSYDPGTGLAAWLGYRPHRYLGGELQLGFVQTEGEFEQTITPPSGERFVTSDVDLTTILLTAGAEVYPLADVAPEWLQPYASAGGGLSWVSSEIGSGATQEDSTEVGFVARFGAGADVNVGHEDLALTFGATYLLTTEAIEDTDLVVFSFGLQLHLD